MDTEQETLQFLGFLGIIKESYNIIFSWPKIFSKITIALIFPLSLIFLAHIQITELLFLEITINEELLDFFSMVDQQKYSDTSGSISSEWTALLLFKVAYFTFFLIFSLLSTSAVVYTIACIYTRKETTFKKVMSVVPKVWKRLFATFIWTYGIFLVFNFVFGMLFFLVSIELSLYGIRLAVFIVLLLSSLIVFVYLTIVWQLASVISVLEDVYGIKALVKSKNLIKGKMLVSSAIFFTLSVLFYGNQLLFEILVVPGNFSDLETRIPLGILCFVLVFKVFLIGLVSQTIFYFVCKSYHHECIDKSSLSGHLEEYLGDYVQLKSKDVQLEELHV